MAKAKAETKTQETGMTKVEAMPSYLKKAADERIGVDQTSKYQTINRIGIVQSQSKKERRDEHGVGSMVMFPDGVLVANPGEGFVGIPVFFYASWDVWSDYNDEEAATILESTLDENHEIARRSKSKATRSERYGESNQFVRAYVESLNVAVLVDSGPAKGELAILSLNKSDHYVGKQIASMIQRSGADIFARRIEFTTLDRSDGKNDWLGFKINNPSEEQGGVWIAEEQYEGLKAVHLETKAAYDANIININRDEEVSTPSGGSAGGFDGDDLPPV